MDNKSLKLQLGKFLKLTNPETYDTFRIVSFREHPQTKEALIVFAEVVIDGCVFDLVLPVAPECLEQKPVLIDWLRD